MKKVPRLNADKGDDIWKSVPFPCLLIDKRMVVTAHNSSGGRLLSRAVPTLDGSELNSFLSSASAVKSRMRSKRDEYLAREIEATVLPSRGKEIPVGVRLQRHRGKKAKSGFFFSG